MLPETFDAKGVEAAVRQAQAGTITYKTFYENVMVAGCSGYIVSLLGRHVVYFGRTAEPMSSSFPPLSRSVVWRDSSRSNLGREPASSASRR
jgi:Protein of unknown function (DUF1398)